MPRLDKSSIYVIDSNDIIPIKKETSRPLLSPDMERCYADHYLSHPHQPNEGCCKCCKCDECCKGVCDCDSDFFLCLCCLWLCIDK